MGKTWCACVMRWGRVDRPRPRLLGYALETWYIVHRGHRFRLTGSAWVGICVLGRAFNHPTQGWVEPGRYRWSRPKVKKKPQKADAPAVRHLAAMESSRFQDLLPIIEHLAVRQYDDGDPREPGWLTIQTYGAAWQVTVKDPDTALSFRVVAETLDKALESVALLLACDEAPWAPDAFLKRGKGKEKK